MSPGQQIAVLLAGIAAGLINTVVGSGTLITFPVLIGAGLSPLTANVSNTVGLLPGSAIGAFGYRLELAWQGRRVLLLGIASVIGGITGALLLLVLPSAAFDAVIPCGDRAGPGAGGVRPGDHPQAEQHGAGDQP